MKLSLRRSVPMLLASSLLAACAVDGTPDAAGPSEVTASVAQAQLDPGDKVWSHLSLVSTSPAATELASVYVFNRELGDFHVGTEYWYVNTKALPLLEEYAFEIVEVSDTTDTAPKPPAYADPQAFTEPEFVSWGAAWSREPSREGTLYTGANGISLRLATSKEGTGTGITDITWSQLIPAKASPQNIVPRGRFVRSDRPLAPAPGYLGYSIHQSTR